MPFIAVKQKGSGGKHDEYNAEEKENRAPYGARNGL